ncbi:glycoside hydrolase family 3 N-terminal domain-containing protein [Glaciihabitans sp. dw_435]|uniref:glycoside hydrolase family 3 N-terminal domain-containing protein n=1 Tax=Glaciihabitans sp. dw_435 TaxID=2720081 RepID=UPI001BD267F4|nr:glycoside hydrolase family 3 N-terminal domain-containing protein [Glaciihabitans sp. dw_435]
MAVSLALIVSGGYAAYGATTDPNPGPLELANGQLSKSAATQGMVLLENHNTALPMSKSGKVALFGVGSYKTVKGGTGSGDVNNRYTVSVREGLTNAGYAITTSPAYYDAMVAAYNAKYPAGSGGIFGPPIDYSSVEQQLTATSVRPTQPTDTAIFVVARNSGEGADRSSGKGDYLLTDTELGDLKLIGQTYKKVVVVLNVGGIVDTSFFASVNAGAKDPSGGTALDSLLLMSQAGQESGNAVTEVLNGTVAPSGKLTDTWASSYGDYPASSTFANNDGDPEQEQYSEGIYVGYRYFDSFYKKIDPANPASVVDYPFGYGLTYTDFTIATKRVSANPQTVKVTAKVTNTGKHTGRQVVQVYFSAPQTGLDKPYQELAGYAKTDSLAPGASQDVTIQFRTQDMSSYDPAKAAYTLQAGDYLVRVGDSSRSTHVAARLNLNRTVTTQQLANEENDRTVDTELTSNPADFYTYASQAKEIAKAPRIALRSRDFHTEQDASRYEQNVPVDSSSPYYALDKSPISSTTAYLPAGTTDWDGTGAPYTAKTGETVKYVSTDPSKTLFDVAKGTYSLKQFVARLTATQLATIVEGSSKAGSTLTAVGAAGYTTPDYESLGLPGMTLSDGPAGLRLTQKVNSTPPTYQFGTAWPIGTLLAQTWDPTVVKKVGTAIGKEMTEYGVTLWLAPGMNIHRDPLNGRNFEYYSEDPLIAGLTASAATLGVQSNKGVGVTLKHFFANNQETSRTSTNAVIDERAIREIYLKGFEIAVRSAQPMAIMTSYNKVNDTYTSGSYDLNTDILRGEWGFKGLVMTDWGAGPRTGATGVYYSGNDLIEPGGNPDEVVTQIKKVAPTIDVSGLPEYSKLTYEAFNFTNWTWRFGGLTPSATGAEAVTTNVDASIIGQQPQSSTTLVDSLFNQTTQLTPPYTSVQAAYADVTALLASDALTADQKAGISITNVVHQTAGDATSPVVSYTVTIRGDYPAGGYPLRLGDLQRSAIHVINVAMQSAGFQELASIQGVSGISVGSYSAQFRHLTQFLTVSRGKVAHTSAPVITSQPHSSVVTHRGSKVTLSAAATGVPRPTVQWQVSRNGGKSWTAVRGASHTSYQFVAGKRDNGAKYRAAFSNSVGTKYTGVTTISVR